MKRIVKGDSPEWFESWKRNFAAAAGRKAVYKNDFPDKERRRLRKGLLEEQGFICCYCMGRLDLDTSHVEHFKPKVRFPDEDMEYKNLLASCQGIAGDAMEDHCGHRKDDWYSPRMVSPASPEIEGMFRYGLDGYVYPAGRDEERRGAKEMIGHLGLNSYYLVRNRETAIEESGFFEEEFTEDEIRDIIDYFDNMDGGAYVPYCEAIVEAWRSLLVKG